MPRRYQVAMTLEDWIHTFTAAVTTNLSDNNTPCPMILLLVAIYFIFINVIYTEMEYFFESLMVCTCEWCGGGKVSIK